MDQSSGPSPMDQTSCSLDPNPLALTGPHEILLTHPATDFQELADVGAFHRLDLPAPPSSAKLVLSFYGCFHVQADGPP